MAAAKLANGLTTKQEEFAKAYLETGNASEAYRRAYNAEKMGANTIHVHACNLLKHDKVAIRLAELQQAAQKRHNVTIDTITEMLKEDRDFAKDVGQAGAKVSATMGLAKLHGLITDKVSGNHTNNVFIQEVKMIVVDPKGETEH